MPLIWGGATNFGQKWGDNTFCPGMGGHEILTWNGGGAGKYHLSLGGGTRNLLKRLENGGDGKWYEEFT